MLLLAVERLHLPKFGLKTEKAWSPLTAETLRITFQDLKTGTFDLLHIVCFYTMLWTTASLMSGLVLSPLPQYGWRHLEGGLRLSPHSQWHDTSFLESGMPNQIIRNYGLSNNGLLHHRSGGRSSYTLEHLGYQHAMNATTTKCFIAATHICYTRSVG